MASSRSAFPSSPRVSGKRRPNIAPVVMDKDEPELSTQAQEQDQLAKFLEDKKLLHDHLEDSAFEKLKCLQSGEGRSVHLVRHLPTGQVLVQKVIHRDGTGEIQKQIMTEVQLLHKFTSPQVVNFYGAYLSVKEQEVNIIMENMNVGCMATVLGRVGRVPERVLAGVTKNVLLALKYVFDEHKCIHRDIKPSNILVNSEGQVKLCDFGVSRTLGSMDMANTFVGTMMYLSPERIQGEKYGVKADMWSLGLTLLELATGNRPLPVAKPPLPLAPMRSARDPAPKAREERRMAPFALINEVLHGERPSVPTGVGFSEPFTRFIDQCLVREDSGRLGLDEALAHPWLADVGDGNEEMQAYFEQILPGGMVDGLDAESRRSSSGSRTLQPMGSPTIAAGGLAPGANAASPSPTKATGSGRQRSTGGSLHLDVLKEQMASIDAAQTP